jgi:hypothetical protein
MATHAIGKGNTLVGICLDQKAKAILGRAALGDNRSLAAFILHHALENLKQVKPTLAQEVQAIREERLRMKQGIACLAVAILCIFSGGDQLRLARRVSRNGKRVEEVAI